MGELPLPWEVWMNLVPVVAYLHLSSDGKPDQAACACIHSIPLTDLGVVQHRSVCRVAGGST